MKKNNNYGISLLQVIIIVIIASAIIGGAFLLLNGEKAKTRDAKRLSDITRIQAAFELLYNQSASYAPSSQSGCNQAGMLVSQCNLKQFIPTISQIKDPGSNTYKVTGVPGDQGFAISFTLEKAYGNLAAGKHTLTQNGIQ